MPRLGPSYYSLSYPGSGELELTAARWPPGCDRASLPAGAWPCAYGYDYPYGSVASAHDPTSCYRRDRGNKSGGARELRHHSAASAEYLRRRRNSQGRRSPLDFRFGSFASSPRFLPRVRSSLNCRCDIVQHGERARNLHARRTSPLRAGHSLLFQRNFFLSRALLAGLRRTLGPGRTLAAKVIRTHE